MRRPTGGYQLSYSRYRDEQVPEYGLVWEGWVSVPGWVTVVDLRDREVINDDVLRDIERDFDLEELRVKEDDLDNDDMRVTPCHRT